MDHKGMLERLKAIRAHAIEGGGLLVWMEWDADDEGTEEWRKDKEALDNAIEFIEGELEQRKSFIEKHGEP